MNYAIFIILVQAAIQLAEGVIGFDCGGKKLNATSFSLITTSDCEQQKPTANSTQTYIELLQVAEYRSIHVIQCKIEIRRTVYYCGWLDHLIPAANGEQEYLHDTSRDICQKLHETGTFMWDPAHYITDLKVNNSRTTGVDFAGKAGNKECKGATFADSFGIWSDVLVQGTIKITLMDYTANIDLNEDTIILRSGTVCKYSKNSCLDMVGG